MAIGRGFKQDENGLVFETMGHDKAQIRAGQLKLHTVDQRVDDSFKPQVKITNTDLIRTLDLASDFAKPYGLKINEMPNRVWYLTSYAEWPKVSPYCDDQFTQPTLCIKKGDNNGSK